MKKLFCLLFILSLTGCATLSDVHNSKGEEHSARTTLHLMLFGKIYRKLLSEMDRNVAPEKTKEMAT